MKHLLLVVAMMSAASLSAVAQESRIHAFVGASQAPAVPPTAVALPGGAEDTLLLRLRALLLAAGIPVGLELRPFGADVQSADPLPPRVVRQPKVAVPGGPPQPGRAGLEAFVMLNRGYELVEGRPVVSIRPVGAASDARDWLNMSVGAYEVRDATLVDALVQLLRQVDPAYQVSRIRGAVDVNATRVSLALSNVTVRDVLDAIALDQHAAWMVSYSGAAPAFETSRMIFSTAQNRTHLAAYPGQPPAEAAPPVIVAPRIIPLPLTITALRNAILSAIRPAPAGFELGSDCNATEAPGDNLALDLTGLQGADVVRLLLAHCPRYEQRTINGVLNIGTVGSFERSRVMSLRARAFGIAQMPMGDTLQVVRQVFDPFGPRSVTGARMMPPRTPAFDNLPPDRAAALRDDMMKPIDVKLDKPTLRDALNGVVAAHGAAYWVVEPVPPPQAVGPMLRFFGYAGWSVGTTFAQGPGPR